MRFLVLPLLALAAGCATNEMAAQGAAREADEQARLDAVLTGYVAGEARSCVNARDLRGPTAYGERTLVFREGRTLWGNQTSGGCEDAGRDALITRQFGPQLCRGEIARTADLVSGFQSGSCSLGEFVPYRKPR